MIENLLIESQITFDNMKPIVEPSQAHSSQTVKMTQVKKNQFLHQITPLLLLKIFALFAILVESTKTALVPINYNIQQYLGNEENINVDIKKDFSINLKTIIPQLDTETDKFRKVESNDFVYRKRIIDTNNDCQPIGNAVVDKKEYSFVLCGLKI